jgi:hypothetical protein
VRQAPTTAPQALIDAKSNTYCESAAQSIIQLRHFFHPMKKNLYNGLKPIPESKMSPEARVASQAHRRATKKKRAELRRRGLPMIVWKDGKVREVPA